MSTLTLSLNSQNHWLADGTQTAWTFSFAGGYITKSHVKAYRESPGGVRTNITVTTGDFLGEFQLQILPAVPAGHTLVIYRDSSNGGTPLVDFTDGAEITEIALDTVAEQSVFMAAEAADRAELAEAAAENVTAVADEATAAAEAAQLDANAAAAVAAAALAAASAAQTSAANAETIAANLTDEVTDAVATATAAAATAAAAAITATDAADSVADLAASLSDVQTQTAAAATYLAKAGGTMTGQLVGSNGTVTVPSYGFANDASTGMYSTSAGVIRWTTGGVLGLTLSTTLFQASVPMLGIVGAVGTPGFRFAGDADTGWWQSALDTQDWSIAGVNRLQLTSTGLRRITGSGSGLTANSNVDDLVLDGSSNVGISMLTPNTASGSIYFGDPESNVAGRIVYAHTADSMTFYTAGTVSMTISSAGLGTFAGGVKATTGGLTAQSGTSTGATANASADDIVVDGTDDNGISLLTDNTGVSYLMFGDTDDTYIGGLRYQHSTDTISIFVGNVYAVTATSGTFSFSTGVDPILSTSTDPTAPGSMGFRGAPVVTRNSTTAFGLTDSGKTIIKTNTTAYTWTISPDATADFPIGTIISLLHDSTAGNITIARGAGVALVNGVTDANQTVTAGNSASIQKVAANRWRFRG